MVTARKQPRRFADPRKALQVLRWMTHAPPLSPKTGRR